MANPTGFERQKRRLVFFLIYLHCIHLSFEVTKCRADIKKKIKKKNHTTKIFMMVGEKRM